MMEFNQATWYMLQLVSYSKHNDMFQIEIMEYTAFISVLKCKIRRLMAVVYRTKILYVLQCHELKSNVVLFLGFTKKNWEEETTAGGLLLMSMQMYH